MRGKRIPGTLSLGHEVKSEIEIEKIIKLFDWLIGAYLSSDNTEGELEEAGEVFTSVTDP